jgi:hypothetical protein
MNPADLPPLTKALLATIADAGYVVGLGRDGEAVVVTATDQAGERHIVRGDTAYAALCELAVQLGFDLKDGSGRPRNRRRFQFHGQILLWRHGHGPHESPCSRWASAAFTLTVIVRTLPGLPGHL